MLGTHFTSEDVGGKPFQRVPPDRVLPGFEPESLNVDQRHLTTMVPSEYTPESAKLPRMHRVQDKNLKSSLDIFLNDTQHK